MVIYRDSPTLSAYAGSVRRAAGSEDGSVRVWELRSGQAVHVMACPAKGPVTGLLVLDRPPFLAAFGTRGGGEPGGEPAHMLPKGHCEAGSLA